MSNFGLNPLPIVLGLKGKSGAVPRNVWVYFLIWGCARLLSPLQKNATKRVCMVESQGYRIWGAPDFCLPPSTSTSTRVPCGAVATSSGYHSKEGCKGPCAIRYYTMIYGEDECRGREPL